jgi:hypothetical protein
LAAKSSNILVGSVPETNVNDEVSNMSNRSQKEIVLSHLEKGNTLSAAQAKNCFRIGNVREVVRRLREEGHLVYTNRKNGKNVYRIGAPRKSSIANLYNNFGANAFS